MLKAMTVCQIDDQLIREAEAVADRYGSSVIRNVIHRLLDRLRQQEGAPRRAQGEVAGTVIARGDHSPGVNGMLPEEEEFCAQ